MPNANHVKIPSYCKHKATGQAVVTLNGRDHYLGKYGTAASRKEYDRLVAEWLVGGHRLATPTAELLMNELALAYWNHATAYHGWNKQRGDYYNLRDALRVVKESYGKTLAKDFGPLALKACRQKMIELDWSRSYVNRQVDRIKAMLKWAASEQMLPASIYHQIATVDGLRKGKTTARETKRVKPVAQEHIDATLPCLPPTVQAMVEFELLTGCRPAEVCIIRPIDLDMKNPSCWVYRPANHKTEHHGVERLILIGPKAQEVLRPFLGNKVDAYCFSPHTSEGQRNANRRQQRKSAMTPSQAKRRAKRNRKRAPGNRYDVNAYRRAIKRACQKANEKAVEAARKINPAMPSDTVLVPQWAPNQLRHARATELRRHGLDVTKTILGHNKVETTQIYAEKDVAAAMELVAKIG
jgi:integrase